MGQRLALTLARLSRIDYKLYSCLPPYQLSGSVEGRPLGVADLDAIVLRGLSGGLERKRKSCWNGIELKMHFPLMEVYPIKAHNKWDEPASSALALCLLASSSGLGFDRSIPLKYPPLARIRRLHLMLYAHASFRQQYFELGINQFPYEAPCPSIHLHLGWQPWLSPGTDLPVGFAKAVLTV